MTSADERELTTDILLQRYLDGACTDEERARIERDPRLQARANELRRLDDLLRRLFIDGTVPDGDRLDPAELIAYVDGTLDAERREIIEQRLAQDAELRAEVEVLRRMGDVPECC